MPAAAAAGMGVVPGAALLMNDCRTDVVFVDVWQIQFTLNDMLIAYKKQKCGDNWNKERTAFHTFDPRPSEVDHPPKCRKPRPPNAHKSVDRKSRQ